MVGRQSRSPKVLVQIENHFESISAAEVRQRCLCLREPNRWFKACFAVVASWHWQSCDTLEQSFGKTGIRGKRTSLQQLVASQCETELG
jgi:hypothetical protein